MKTGCGPQWNITCDSLRRVKLADMKSGIFPNVPEQRTCAQLDGRMEKPMKVIKGLLSGNLKEALSKPYQLVSYLFRPRIDPLPPSMEPCTLSILGDGKEL
jgi:hypothetical protein